MTRSRAVVALLVVVAMATSLTACATETTTRPDKPLAGGPTATATWPVDCREHVGEARDYVSSAKGYPSRTTALLAEAPGPGYRLEQVPPEAHRRASWWIVAIKTDEIYARASVFHGHRGWLVDELERCA
jgi:hypothetical protein